MALPLRHPNHRLFPLSLLVALLAAPPDLAAAERPRASHAFRTTDGVTLRWFEAGPGTGTELPLVFVPGWTMPAELWRSQVDHFGRMRRTLAFDPRGQGASDLAPSGYTLDRRTADIAEFLASARVDRAVVVGWSLGVLELLHYLRRNGDERIAAVVLVDNSIGEQPPPPPSDFVKRLRADREATVARFVAGMFRAPQSDTFLADLTRQSLRMPLKDSIALLSYPVPREQWKDAVYAIRRPVLYVVTPRLAGQAENFRRNRPDADVHVFENAGHALFLDDPGRFNQVLEAFLTRAVLK